MKNLLASFVLLLFVTSCSFETQSSQDSSIASEAFIYHFLKGEFEAIYEDGAIEMKSYVPKDIFLNIHNTQLKLYGKMVEATLQNESSGNYGTKPTKVYTYALKSEKGVEYKLTTEFLNGHLMKNHMEEIDWYDEPELANDLVAPVSTLVMNNNSEAIYELLDKKYPMNQIEPLIQRISEDCKGVPNKYESSWIDNDESGKMLLGIVYAYEKLGFLEYRYYIEKDEYPFAGIFFQPDTTVELPK